MRFYDDYYDISEGFPRPEAPFTKKVRTNQSVFDEMFENVRTGKGGMGIEDPFDPKPNPKPKPKSSVKARADWLPLPLNLFILS